MTTIITTTYTGQTDQTYQNTFVAPSPYIPTQVDWTTTTTGQWPYISLEEQVEKLWKDTTEGFDISLKDFRRMLNRSKDHPGIKEAIEQAIVLFRLVDDGADEESINMVYTSLLNTMSQQVQNPYTYTIGTITSGAAEF